VNSSTAPKKKKKKKTDPLLTTTETVSPGKILGDTEEMTCKRYINIINSNIEIYM